MLLVLGNGPCSSRSACEVRQYMQQLGAGSNSTLLSLDLMVFRSMCFSYNIKTLSLLPAFLPVRTSMHANLPMQEEVALKFITDESPEASGVAATAYLLADERARPAMYGPPVVIASPSPLTVPPPAALLNSPYSTPPTSPPRSPARQQAAAGSDMLAQSSCDHIQGEPVLFTFPPCVVSPRGNSLSSWGLFLRKQTDRKAACTVRNHTSSAVWCVLMSNITV